MFISKDLYSMLLKKYQKDELKFNYILYFKILDELFDHGYNKTIPDTSTEWKLDTSYLFTICEDFLIDFYYKKGLFHKYFIKEYKFYSMNTSSNYVILSFLFSNFNKVFKYISKEDSIKIRFNNGVQASKFEEAIDNFKKKDFIDDIFFN